MAYELDNQAQDVLRLYELKGLPTPMPRAFALRLLEEAVELALACGASAQDAYLSVDGALQNEQMKHPSRGYDEKQVVDVVEVAGEIADVCLLARLTADVSGVADDTISVLATSKVDRLVDAADRDALHFTADGRFYRRAKQGAAP